LSEEVNPTLNIELFEKPLIEKLLQQPLTVSETSTFKITRVSPGVYSIIINLPDLGDQEFKLTFIDGQFRLSGYLSIIGKNASFPLSYAADIVNAFVANWIQRLVDNSVTK
jgi:hypothetical protein